MAYDQETKDRALALLDAGYTQTDVAKEIGITQSTLYRWKKNRPDMFQEASARNIRRQIALLSSVPEPSESTARKITMLSKALERITTAARKAQREKKKKPVIVFSKKKVLALRKKALAPEYGLFEYQKKFLRSESQFRIWLKARQIGASYIAGLDALISAYGGRSQLFLSASEEQAIILMRYVQHHAERMKIDIKPSDREIQISGATIKAMAHNFRTVQGFTGDIWMDEFAWYPNPKRIWHAFVPSIGAIRGRLTIMSTPFEQGSLFEELVRDKSRYYMFDRFLTDIYQAIKDGLKFDLETMRALFDADTWASAYECHFVDDEEAAFSINLIKLCVDAKIDYYTPSSRLVLWSGYDIGRTKDASALAILAPKGDKFRLANMELLRKASFEEQKNHLKNFMGTYPLANLRIDKTGIGMNLAEDIKKIFKRRVVGVTFTNTIKEFMVLNLKKIFEEKRIIIPNRQDLIRDIHSIKRKAGQKSFRYDSDRTKHGHADQFWALALAASHIEHVTKRKGGRAWII